MNIKRVKVFDLQGFPILHQIFKHVKRRKRHAVRRQLARATSFYAPNVPINYCQRGDFPTDLTKWAFIAEANIALASFYPAVLVIATDHINISRVTGECMALSSRVIPT